ncbi:hypothetical protein FXO38_15946 [Capsicum annuum]|nr:hypothetical protein FXO38_15946 [Capsicum annuum]
MKVSESMRFDGVNKLLRPFIEGLKMGEMIEDEIKTGRIMSFATLKTTTQAIQKDSGSVGSHPQTLQTYQSPFRPDFWSKPNNEMRQKSRDRFTPIGESYVSSFQRLVQWGMITPLLGYISDPHSRSFDPNVRCAYHSDAQGHSIEDCRVLKREIEKMIQDESIMVQNTDGEKSSNYADMQINC